MIDYEKLKQAHDLAEKYTLDKEWDELIYIMIGFGKLDLRYSLIIYKDGVDQDINTTEDCQFTYDIDELISKLQELTAPKPKYEFGVTLFYAKNGNEICELKTRLVDSYFKDNNTFFIYSDDKWDGEEGPWIDEYRLHLSKEALIDGQIDYWSSLKTEEISTRSDDMSIPPIKKDLELKLIDVQGNCPWCGSTMADYAGLDIDGIWRTGCSYSMCGFVRELPPIEGEAQCINPTTNNLPIATKLVVDCDHEPSTNPMLINPGNYFCKKCEEFYR
jgi:hypothetical protein